MLGFSGPLKGYGQAIAAAQLAIQEVNAARGIHYQPLLKGIRPLKQGKTINYQGLSGNIHLNRPGDNVAAVFEVWRFKQGNPTTARFEHTRP